MSDVSLGYRRETCMPWKYFPLLFENKPIPGYSKLIPCAQTHTHERALCLSLLMYQTTSLLLHMNEESRLPTGLKGHAILWLTISKKGLSYHCWLNEVSYFSDHAEDVLMRNICAMASANIGNITCQRFHTPILT